MAPLEFDVLKNESQKIRVVQIFRVFHHFHRILSLCPFNISMDAFTSDIAVKSLGELLFNAVPALWVAFLQIL